MVINMFFGYCFYLGGLMRWNLFRQGNGDLMSSGVIMTIIFLVIISVMTLATAGNGLPAINGENSWKVCL